jgi:succinate-acetate transporter protein
VLLYVTIAIGILRSAMEDTRLAGIYGLGFLVFVQIFVFTVLCLICFFILNRRNWARIVYLVMTVIGTPLSIKPLLESFTATPISGVLGVIQAAIGIVAAILLFRPQAASWFRRIPVE